MPANVDSLIDRSNIETGNNFIEREDFITPFDDIVDVFNAILNGTLSAEAFRFDELGAAPDTPATGKWKLYAKADGLYYVDDAGVETGPLGESGGGDASSITYTPDVGGDWDTPPDDVAEALDELANRVTGVEGGGGGGGAPDNATYITQTPSAVLTDEQALSLLGTGIMKNTTGTGVISIAVGADLPSHTHDASVITYTPTTAADWDGSADPGDVDNALDQLAERTADLEGTSYDASVITYTPTTAADWDGSADPGDVNDALDQLAERTADLEAGGGGGGTKPYAILQDQKAAGTNGGSSTSGSRQTRTLNTEVVDADSIVTLSSNEFTPIAGDYILNATSVFNNSGIVRIYLRNVTAGADVTPGGQGVNTRANASGSNPQLTNVHFTANGTDAYSIQYRCTASQVDTGQGSPANFGSEVEIFTSVYLEKQD